MISRTNLVLAALFGIVAVSAAVSGVDYSKPNIEIFANSSMKYSPASTPYESSNVFANKMTQQDPVRGTIARGTMPIHFAALPAPADPATVAPKDAVPGKELENPFGMAALLQQVQSEYNEDGTAAQDGLDAGRTTGGRTDTDESDSTLPASNKTDGSGSDSSAAGATINAPTPGSVEESASTEAVANNRFQASIGRGNDIFVAFCVCCHGPEGKGNGMVAQRGYPPPPSFLTGTSKDWNDGQLFHILTYGRVNMPPFAAELPRETRWDVINYVRTLQDAAAMEIPDVPDGSNQPSDRGEGEATTPPEDESPPGSTSGSATGQESSPLELSARAVP